MPEPKLVKNRYVAEERDAINESEQPLRNEVHAAFKSGRVECATDEELRRWLKTLATVRTKVVRNRPRDMIRAAFINHVQHIRQITTLEKENSRLQKHVRLLTLFAAIFAFIALVCAACQTYYAALSYTVALSERQDRLDKEKLAKKRELEELNRNNKPLPVQDEED